MEIVLPVEACSCIYVMIKRKALDVSVAAKSAIAHAVGLEGGFRLHVGLVRDECCVLPDS